LASEVDAEPSVTNCATKPRRGDAWRALWPRPSGHGAGAPESPPAPR